MKRSLSIPSIIFLVLLMLPLTGRGQWVQTNGPHESFPLVVTTSLATIGPNLVAGTNPDGIFLSTNDGESWSLDTENVGSHTVECLAVDGSEVFAGTYDEGVLISRDSGLTWTRLDSVGMGYPDVLELAAKNGSILASTHRGFAVDSELYRTTNNGSNWVRDTAGLGGNGLEHSRWSLMVSCSKQRVVFIFLPMRGQVGHETRQLTFYHRFSFQE